MPASKAQQRAVNKYMKENYDEIKVRIEKGRKTEIQAHAQAQGESVNGFIGRAIASVMARDSASTVPTQASPQASETPQDELLVLVEVGYDPIAERPLYSEKVTGKQYYAEPVPIDIEISDTPDDMPF